MTLVPSGLLPRWRDLPALAWLVAGNLGGSIVHVAVIGPVARALGWMPTLAILLAARTDRCCAAYGRSAFLTIGQLYPRRLRPRYWSAFVAILPAAVVLLVLPPTVLVVAAAVAGRLWPAVETALLVAAALSFLSLAGLMFAAVAPGLRSVARSDRRNAREWAARHGIALAEGSFLAAAGDDPRAATVLIRRLVTHADRQGLAVIACPRDAELAAKYRRLRFAALPGGSGRIMLRPPQPLPAVRNP